MWAMLLMMLPQGGAEEWQARLQQLGWSVARGVPRHPPAPRRRADGADPPQPRHKRLQGAPAGGAAVTIAAVFASFCRHSVPTCCIPLSVRPRPADCLSQFSASGGSVSLTVSVVDCGPAPRGLRHRRPSSQVGTAALGRCCLLMMRPHHLPRRSRASGCGSASATRGSGSALRTCRSSCFEPFTQASIATHAMWVVSRIGRFWLYCLS